MHRRNFLQLSTGAAFAGIFPDVLAGVSPRWDRILILVELNGGNDGLNTLVPFRDDTYYRLRRYKAKSFQPAPHNCRSSNTRNVPKGLAKPPRLPRVNHS